MRVAPFGRVEYDGSQRQMSSKPSDIQYLSRLRRRVEKEIDEYVYDVPETAIGDPKPQAAIDAGFAQMRTALVEPYWAEVEVRDTIEQIGMSKPLRRNCAVIADDGQGMLLMFDPVEDSFVLAQRWQNELQTIGVRGDAVGCFLAR
jgi:hypothetical protein